MNRVRFYILTILIILFSNNGIAQHGYLGNLKCAEIGVTSNVGLFNFMPKQENIVIDESTFLFPKIELGYQILRKKTALRFNAKYSVLPNVEQYLTSSEYKPEMDVTISDSNRMRSNVYGLSFNFRKFINVAPLGWYIQFGFGADFVHNKSIHSRYITKADFVEQVNSYSEMHVVSNNLVLIGEVPLGIGKVIPLGRRLTLDVGFRSSFMVADFRYDEDVAYDLRVKGIQKWVNLRSFLSYNLIGIYAGIQLFH